MKASKRIAVFVGILILLGVSFLICQTVLWQGGTQSKSIIENDTTKRTRLPVQSINGESTVSPTVEQPRPLGRGEPLPMDVRKALLHGAKAKVTFRVRDAMGRAVEGATISGGFYNHGKKGYGFRGLTDSDGVLEQENISVLDLNYSVEKEGHYRSSGRHWFFKEGADCVENGRWIPWNKTIEVVLKEKRKPIPMYVKGCLEKKIPKEVKIGFDILKADFVRPHGTGEISDFTIFYTSNSQPPNTLTNRLVLSTSQGSGIICKNKDLFSLFWSLYEAPNDGYSQKMVFDYARGPDEIYYNTKLKEEEYLILRSRVEKNGEGMITAANYAKFYCFAFDEERGNKEGYLRFMYYYNPTPNDRNLEFDGKNNLFKPAWNDSMNQITQP